MATLTNADKRLLTYPPGKEAWYCGAPRIIDGVKRACGMLNGGTAKKCWLCTAKKKPLRGPTPYDLYETACKKAGIEPYTRWPVKVVEEDEKPKKPTRRRRQKG